MAVELGLNLDYYKGANKTGQAGPVIGSDRELLTTVIHGKHYYANKRGRLFIAASATGGIAIIVAATTGGHPTLWNPQGSERDISIKKLRLGYVSGANAPGSLAWNITERAGSAAATAAPIPTATLVDVESAYGGETPSNKALWSPTTNTFTAAPVYWRPTALSLFTGVAATAVAPFVWGEDYEDDDLMFGPGVAVSLVAQQATTTALFRVMIEFEEKDR